MYRHAHWIVLAVCIATVSGFVPTYFLAFDYAETRHHVHVLTATSWMTLLFLQPFLASRGKLHWHRKLGWTSAVVFPLLAITSVYMLWYSSAVDLARGGVFPKLYWMDYWVVPAMILFWIAGIANRKNTAIHQRCMLLTLIALAPPGYGRALFFYVLHPLGFGFDDIWHPMLLLMLAALLWMLVADRFRYWPTQAAFVLVAFVYVTSFWIADAQWWFDFIQWVAREPSV